MDQHIDFQLAELCQYEGTLAFQAITKIESTEGLAIMFSACLSVVARMKLETPDKQKAIS